jgi:hypothetical protein
MRSCFLGVVAALVMACLSACDDGGGDPDGSGTGAAPSGTGGATATGGTGVTGGATGNEGGAPTTATGGSSTGGASSTGGGNSTGGATTGDGPTAREAATAMGRGVNLGQMFDNTQHPRTLEKASVKIDAYYAKGFRNIRIPITWTEAVGGDRLVNDPAVGDVNREHPRLKVIEQVVDYALSKPGLYVVINTHHERALKTQNRAAVLERLWTDISDLFKKRDKRLIYELLNEPHLENPPQNSPMPPENLRAMIGKAYTAIRKADPERILVIGGNQWFGAHEMANAWPNLDAVGGGKDAFLMSTFHHYSPWTFCGDNQGTYDDAWTDSSLSQPMETMLKWANGVGKGMPVYIGEWGVGWGSRYDKMECNNIRSWYQKMHKENAATKDIPTSVWDDGGWFKIFDHGTDTWNNNLADCIVGECAWDGAERFNAGCK